MSTVDVGCGIELAVDDADDTGDDELCNEVEEKLEEPDRVEEDTLKADVADFEKVFELNIDGEVLLVLKALDEELLLTNVWLDGIFVEYEIFLDDGSLVLGLTDDIWLSGDLLKEALVEEDLLDEVLTDEDLLEILLKEVRVDDRTLVEEILPEIVPRTVLLAFPVVVGVVFALDFPVEDVLLVLDVFFDELGPLMTHLQACLTARTLKLGIGES